jgi:3-hydroxyisobutyrate dehydrogenase-like beta-hydroxyacid dehydrogenase
MRKPLRIALLGTGKFGAAMAQRLLALLDSGARIRVWNRSNGPTKRLGKLGAEVARTPAECVQDAQFVLAVLADGAVTLEVLRAALPSMKRGAVVVDASTSGRRAAKACARLLAKRGVDYVDAAMSGTVEPAKRGELVAMVGASPRLLRRTRPLLDLLCRRVIHAGELGQGQALKVVLNGIGAHHFVGFASMLALGERAGLDRRVLVDAFTTGAFASPSYVGKKEKVLRRDYRADFALALAAKDAALNLELQREVGLRLPVVRALAAEIAAAVERGLGDSDLFGIERHYARATRPRRSTAAKERPRPARRSRRR